MANERNPQRAPERPAPPAAAKEAADAVVEMKLEERPNLTQLQVEGFVQSRLQASGKTPEEAAAEAKKRAAEVVKTG